MAEFQKINLGAAANDKTGTPARQAGNIINNNFDIVAAEIFQDKILKYGPIALSGLNVNIAANAFAWRINQVEFLTPLAFSQAITVASDGKYRTDSIVGTDTGAYLYVPGTESTTQTGPPTIPANTIRVGNVNIFGSIISEPVVIVPTPAKTIPLVGNDKIVINDSQDSEKTKTRTWQEVSSQITEGIFIPDTVIRTTEPTRVGNEFTFPVDGYEVLLNKTRRSNTNQLKVTPVAATTDYKRVDLVYFKPDNTLASIQGVESTSVAVRPEVPVGSIAIYFINIFGATIEAPTPIDKEISIQDVFGTSIFNIKDYIRFEGVSFNPAQKLISINPLVPLSAFLDIVNGSDVTGTIENSKKPFKTINALLNALPPTTGETYSIYITGGTVEVLRKIPSRNFNFIAYSNTTFDFTNCKENDGITEAQYCIEKLAAYGTWTFLNENISLKCIKPTIIKQFCADFPTVFTPSVAVKGTIKTLDWQALFSGNSASFVAGFGSDFTVINAINSLSNNTMFLIDGKVVINNLSLLAATKVFFKVNVSATLLKVTGGNFTTTVVSNGGGARCFLLNIKDVDKLNTFDIGIPVDKVVFMDSIINNSNVYASINGIVSGKISTLTGSASINCVPFFGQTRWVNFTGKISQYKMYGNTKAYFEESNITVPTTLVVRATGGQANTFVDCVDFVGSNTIRQENTLFNLFGEGDAGLPINIKKFGPLYTNAKSYGLNVTYEENAATFKEKLNEIVIRSKKDIANKVLSSDTTYVIDGLLTFLTGEYIEIPPGGLTLAGYGFDVSQIIKNVSGQSIFKSPVGGSGNLVSHQVRYNSGAGSVFDIVDSNGTHAIEVNDINFQSCASLGKIKGYRQVTGHTIGMYDCADGLIVSGAWNGFVISKLHVRNFATTGTLFKKDTDTTFSNRFSLGVNISGNAGFKIADFDNTIFTKDETFQLDDCTIEVDGVISATNTPSLIPNISPNDPKCRWVNSTGIQLSAVKFQDIKSPDGSIWRLTVSDLGAPTWTELV